MVTQATTQLTDGLAKGLKCAGDLRAETQEFCGKKNEEFVKLEFAVPHIYNPDNEHDYFTLT